MKKTWKPMVAAVLLIACIAAVLTVTMPGCTGPYENTLKNNSRYEQTWDQQKIRDYSFEISWTFDNWPPEAGRETPVTIEVRGGAAQSIKYTDTGSSVPNPGFYMSVDNLSKLFAVIREMARLGQGKVTAYYDARYGYPERIDNVYYLGKDNTEGTVTTSYQVSNFMITESQ